MKFTIQIGAILFVSSAFANEQSFTCKETNDAWVSHENGGLFSKPGPRGGHDDNPKNPLVLKVTINGSTGHINGPYAKSGLKLIAANTFIETSEAGNIIMWTLIMNSDGKYLVKQNAANLIGLTAFTVVFECR